MNVKPITLNLEGKPVFERKTDFRGNPKWDKTKATLLAKGKDRSLFVVQWGTQQNILFLNKEYFAAKYGEENVQQAYG